MSWNYRVCYTRFKNFDPELHDPEDEFTWGIYEVYYVDGDTTKIRFHSTEPTAPFGNTREQLCLDFDLMKKAFDLPPIFLDEVKFVKEEDT